MIGADGANSRVAKEIDAGDYDYAIAFQVQQRKFLTVVSACRLWHAAVNLLNGADVLAFMRTGRLASRCFAVYSRRTCSSLRPLQTEHGACQSAESVHRLTELPCRSAYPSIPPNPLHE